jgi:hypothetical protein
MDERSVNSLLISLRLFVVRAWVLVALAVACVVNPVRVAQLMGWLKPGYTLPLSPLQFQLLLGAVLLVSLFIWFHRQRVAFELVRPADPQVMFTDMLRHLASRSRWAAKDSRDDDWVKRLERDVLDKLSIGTITAYGRRYSPQGDREFAMSPIPAEFWRTASLYVFDIMNERSTQQTVHSVKPGGPAYTEIFFDRGQLRQVWAPRSWWAALTRRSPAERRGNVHDWRERDKKLDTQARAIRDGLWNRLHEGDARAADKAKA